MEGSLDHCRHPIVFNAARPAWARLIQQAINTIPHNAPPPLADGMFVNASSTATALLAKPSAQRKTIRQRSENDRDTRWRRT